MHLTLNTENYNSIKSKETNINSISEITAIWREKVILH